MTTVVVRPVQIAATQIVPGDRLYRIDTGEHVYTVESVEQVTLPDETGEPTSYVRAMCAHFDGPVLPHHWKALDRVTMYR